MSEEISNKWSLPDPVFRQSTGELVKPSETVPADPEPDTLEPFFPVESTTASEPDSSIPSAAEDQLSKLYSPPDGYVEPIIVAPPRASTVAIEPQPFISEQFTVEKIVTEPEKPKAKNPMRPVMFGVGILVLLGVLGGFIALVYYLFFAGRPNSSGF